MDKEIKDCSPHDWPSGSWGVIIGVARCRKCEKLSTPEDFMVAQVANGAAKSHRTYINQYGQLQWIG